MGDFHNHSWWVAYYFHHTKSSIPNTRRIVLTQSRKSFLKNTKGLQFIKTAGLLYTNTYKTTIFRSRPARAQCLLRQMDFRHRCGAKFRPVLPNRLNQPDGGARLALRL